MSQLNPDLTIGQDGVLGDQTALSDEVEVMMLGAGSCIQTCKAAMVEAIDAGLEVGRSCCVIKYRGATVVCDTGIHPAYSGIPALPYVDELDWSTVDAILVTHFHVDHAASLPYILEKTNFKEGGGHVYMTHPTKDVFSFMMRDFVRMGISPSDANSANKLFDEAELDASFKSIIGVSFQEEIFVPSRTAQWDTTIAATSAASIKFTSYPAGHVLGAAMFLIEIAGARILYTGDFSTEEDRHLIPASVPNWTAPPDVMISEATFGVQTLEPREEKESRLTALVQAILTRGGRVLMPVFALGRAQELLLILDEYWEAHPELHQYPIYYVSALAAKCMRVYKTHTSSLNANVQRRAAQGDHPFDFGRGRHIRELKDVGRRFDDKTPCVVMASPGMLQNGVSRQLLEKWAPDRRNGLVLCGYSVEGTLARTLQNEPEDFTSLDGKKIIRRMSVEYISFAAHVDYSQNSRFIDDIKPAHLVLCHGEYNNCQRLRSALKKAYADRKQDIQIYAPANTEAVKIKLTRTHIARAIGSIAKATPTEGSTLSGVLVAKDSTYTLLAASDLQQFTGLSTTVIRQQQRLQLNVGWDMIRYHLESMYGEVEQGLDDQDVETFRVMNAVDVKKSTPKYYTLEWCGSTTSDMIADSVLALLLGIDRSPATVKMTTHSHSHSHSLKHEMPQLSELDRADAAKLERLDNLLGFLDAQFQDIELLPILAPIKQEDAPDVQEGADEKPRLSSVAPTLKLTLDANVAYVPLDTFEVQCTSEAFKKRVESVIELALEVTTPLSSLAPPQTGL